MGLRVPLRLPSSRSERRCWIGLQLRPRPSSPTYGLVGDDGSALCRSSGDASCPLSLSLDVGSTTRVRTCMRCEGGWPSRCATVDEYSALRAPASSCGAGGSGSRGLCDNGGVRDFGPEDCLLRSDCRRFPEELAAFEPSPLTRLLRRPFAFSILFRSFARFASGRSCSLPPFIADAGGLPDYSCFTSSWSKRFRTRRQMATVLVLCTRSRRGATMCAVRSRCG